MKTKLFSVALMMCAVLSGIKTGCKEKNTPTNTDDPNKATLAYMESSFTVNEDLLNLVNVVIDYYDNEGKAQSTTMTSGSWENKVKVALPCKVGTRIKFVLKDGVDPVAAGAVHMAYAYNYMSYATNESNYVLTPSPLSDGKALEVTTKDGKFGEFLQDADPLFMTLIEYDANGNPTVLNEWK